MGIIRRQSLFSSVFLLLGFFIGGINTVFLFPKILTQTEYGLTRALIDTAIILSMLSALGTQAVIFKFHPYYKSLTKNTTNDLPFVTGAICLAGFILICICGYVFEDFIIRKLGKSPLFAQYFFLVYPFTFLMLTYLWLESFGWALKRTILTNFLKETLVRIITTVLIVFLAVRWISRDTFLSLFSCLYLLPVIILLFVLISSKEWRINFKISRVTKKFGRKMLTFGLFVFGATFLNIASRTIDTFMIVGLKGLEKTAVFTIAAYLITLMDLPVRSIGSISVPVLSEAWRAKNYKSIFSIYQKSTLTLLVAGLFIFCLVMLNVGNLVLFLSNDWAEVPQVVLVMGLAKLIDLGTGVNGQVIGTSTNWRFDFFTNVFLTVIAFPLNFFMIKYFGIVGAAYANLIANCAFNSVRYFFIFRKYGWQPYRFAHLQAIFIAAIVFLAVYALPFMLNIYADTIFRSVLFAGLFIPAMLRLQVSDELTSVVQSMRNRLFRNRMS